MSKELNAIAKEHQSKKSTIVCKELNLYRTTISAAASAFLRETEALCKKQRQSRFKFISIIEEEHND
jgi:hypothetical protein